MNFPKTPSFNLAEKRALVVGASSGIGLGCAVALAEHGAEVTLAARRINKLKELQEKFISEGWKAKTIHLDVFDVENTKKLIFSTGPYDILINSAGAARHSKATEVDQMRRLR